MQIHDKTGKVELFEIATGNRVERLPVDAREMVACGSYKLTQSEATAAKAAQEAADKKAADTAARVQAKLGSDVKEVGEGLASQAAVENAAAVAKNATAAK